MKKLLTLTWVALLVSFGAGAEQTKLISLDDGKLTNASGGLTGSWGTRGGRVKASVQGEGEEKKVYSLRFDYNVSSERQDAGYWFALAHGDMRPFDAVRLDVRGQNGEEMLAFGFKDDRWYEERISLEKYLESPISKEWQTVTVPLKDFAKVRQWDSMDNFSISFLNSKKYLPKSSVYVRNIELVSLDPAPPPSDVKTGKAGKSAKKAKARPAKRWHELIHDERAVFPIPFDTQTATDDQMLDLVERAAFGYFWNEANPRNGLIKDRCYAFGPDQRKVASVASVGFGLSAICVAEKRGWISQEQAYERVLTTLKFFNTEAQMYNGFYFHFYEMDTGAPLAGCEISSVDTGLLLMGVITAKQYYKGTEIEGVAQEILEKVDWPWMQNGEKFLSHGWHPGNKFIAHQWRDYNEAILLYFIAIGSPTHPISETTWNLVDREVMKYKGREFVPAAGENSLFEHQYPQVWLDFRGLIDKNKVDYWDNSVAATEANRDWCLDNADKSQTFSEGFWGLTACDGPTGYIVHGAPFGSTPSDGTVAPTAPLTSLPFTPEAAMEQLRKYFKYQKRVWGKYGFVDAFNLDKDWFSSVHIGIDQGPILLMIENHRSGMIWDLVSREPMIQKSFERIGFQKVSIPDAPVVQ
jgi:hypothetical protein